MPSKNVSKIVIVFDRFCLDLASQRAPKIHPIFDFFGSVSAPGINLEATRLQKAARAPFGRYFLRFLIVLRLFWQIFSLISYKCPHIFPWNLIFLTALYNMNFEHFNTCCNLSEAVPLVELSMQVPCAVLVFYHFALKLIICTCVPIVAFRCRLAATGYRR